LKQYKDMAKKKALKPTLPYNDLESTDADSFVGSQPEVSEVTLVPENRVIESVSQAVDVTDNDIQDATTLIAHAAAITARKQGQKPYSTASLKKQAKNYMVNISTGVFATELRRASPRLYTPILTASTLTAASLPPGWPDGPAKTEYFREVVTKAIRSWKQWDFFVRGMAQEVVDYGFGFACAPDKYEWKPKMIRMDRGFVPVGTEIMDESLARFTMLWDYQPNELLKLAKDAESGWNKEAVAYAVQKAGMVVTDYEQRGFRKWEELISEAPWNMTYTKKVKVIKTRHLFVLETTGKVSHYILNPDAKDEYQLLFERLDAFESMADVVTPLVFSFGDGTIHGSWGAGQLLYDMAVQLDKLRCDMLHNLRLSNKIKLQVPEAKDINKVKLEINDNVVIASEATFANNIAGITANPAGYQIADGQVLQWMQQRIGAYLPPIPMQSSDIKAAQINAALAQEQEIQKDVLENWLKQFAHVIQGMIRRMLSKENPSEFSKMVRMALKGEATDRELQKIYEMGIGSFGKVALTDDEIEILANQPIIQSILEFTDFATQRRAAFASSVLGNSLFNQNHAAQLMAQGAGGTQLMEYMVVKEGDTATQTGAQRQQIMELTSLSQAIDIPVVVSDEHWIHMQTMKEPMTGYIAQTNIPAAEAAFRHYVAHYQAALATKTLPKEVINPEKSFVAEYEKAINAVKEEQAKQQQMQAQQAQQLLAQQALAGGNPQLPM
jgi:hypothetical protein